MQADGSWTNSGGLHNMSPVHKAGQCVVPSTPILTTAVRYVAETGFTTQTLFQQAIVTPEGFNFGGRTMAEKFPVSGPNGCWGPGAPFSKNYTHTTLLAPIPNLGIPSVYDDYLAWPDAWVVWIRQNQSTLPCSIAIYQDEYIDCASNTDPDTFRQRNLLVFTVDKHTVRHNRGGRPSADLTFGPPPSKEVLAAPLHLILKR